VEKVAFESFFVALLLFRVFLSLCICLAECESKNISFKEALWEPWINCECRCVKLRFKKLLKFILLQKDRLQGIFHLWWFIRIFLSTSFVSFVKYCSKGDKLRLLMRRNVNYFIWRQVIVILNPTIPYLFIAINVHPILIFRFCESHLIFWPTLKRRKIKSIR